MRDQCNPVAMDSCTSLSLNERKWKDVGRKMNGIEARTSERRHIIASERARNRRIRKVKMSRCRDAKLTWSRQMIKSR
jgi:hypothetical protein